jgi:hypothetical protein
MIEQMLRLHAELGFPVPSPRKEQIEGWKMLSGDAPDLRLDDSETVRVYGLHEAIELCLERGDYKDSHCILSTLSVAPTT